MGTSKTLQTVEEPLKAVEMPGAGCLGIPLTLLSSQRGPGTGLSAPFPNEGSLSPRGLGDPQGSSPPSRKVPWAQPSSGPRHPLTSVGSASPPPRSSLSFSSRGHVISYFPISEDSESISPPVCLEEELI